ncbi:MAG: hypothetical protein HGGPFJEG_02416 [Ignavibacteria bacterium]|nr:hypothetical protein [Ignavibacteria bacterium]
MKQSDCYRKQTENKYSEMFDFLKQENYDDSFYKSEIWLRGEESSDITKIKKNERIFIKMKNYFISHKLKIAYSFIMLAFIIAACSYPVSQEKNLGDVISWTINKNNTDALEKINSMEWINTGNLYVNEKNINGNIILEYNLILPKDSHDKAESLRNQLGAISGISSLKVVPLNEKVTRPVYSFALNKIFKVDINATNMSNDELKNEITSQLEKNGINGVKIEIESGKDGRRISRIFIPESSIKDEGGFDMTIKDGNNEERIKEVRKKGSEEEMLRFKGKSDDEIKKMLIEELNDKGITEDMIQIDRDGDKVMIKINAGKQGSDKKYEFESEEK